MDWVGRAFKGVENHNENRSGSIVLFIENLDVNETKFKKEFTLRGGKRKGVRNINLILGVVKRLQFRYRAPVPQVFSPHCRA